MREGRFAHSYDFDGMASINERMCEHENGVDEEQETWCPVCEAHSVIYNFDEKIWYCQRCGKVM